MTSKYTQASAVLAWCERNKSITSKDAIEQLGITRLAAVIHDIRKLGYSVVVTREKVPSRYGFTNIARYAIEKTDKICQGK